MIDPMVRDELQTAHDEAYRCTFILEWASGGKPQLPEGATKAKRIAAAMARLRALKQPIIDELRAHTAVEVHDLAALPQAIVTAPVATWRMLAAEGATLDRDPHVRVRPNLARAR